MGYILPLLYHVKVFHMWNFCMLLKNFYMSAVAIIMTPVYSNVCLHHFATYLLVSSYIIETSKIFPMHGAIAIPTIIKIAIVLQMIVMMPIKLFDIVIFYYSSILFFFLSSWKFSVMAPLDFFRKKENKLLCLCMYLR